MTQSRWHVNEPHKPSYKASFRNFSSSVKSNWTRGVRLRLLWIKDTRLHTYIHRLFSINIIWANSHERTNRRTTFQNEKSLWEIESVWNAGYDHTMYYNLQACEWRSFFFNGNNKIHINKLCMRISRLYTIYYIIAPREPLYVENTKVRFRRKSSRMEETNASPSNDPKGIVSRPWHELV